MMEYAAVEQVPVDPMIGRLVAGRYEVVRLIDRGGMAAVYKVRHQHLKRSFAMKTMAPELANAPEALARFRREAEIVAALRHPNIIDVVDWDTLYDGSPCMIMELLRGEDLWDRLERTGPMRWRDIARIGDEILSALVVAHRAGIVHRDIKPQNIYLHVDDSGDEHAMLLDFGVSKLRNSRTLAATDTRLVGTPAYMAPEQADGQGGKVGPAADVWAMGAILYELATGEEAFGAQTIPSILYRICHQAPTPIGDLRPDVPPRFARLIELTLNRDPRKRIQTAKQLRAGLRSALNSRYLRALARERGAEDTKQWGQPKTECVFGVVPMATYRASADANEFANRTTLAQGTNHRKRMGSEAFRALSKRRREPAVLLAGVLALITLTLFAAWVSPSDASGAWPPEVPAVSAAVAQIPAAIANEPAPRVTWPDRIVTSAPVLRWGMGYDEPEPEPEPELEPAIPEPLVQAPPPKRGKNRKVRRIGNKRAKPPAKRPPAPPTVHQPAVSSDDLLLPPRPSKDNVSDQIKKLDRAVGVCRNRSGASGLIAVPLTVAPSGKVAQSYVEGGTREFKKCLSVVFPRLKFERSRDGIQLKPKFLAGEK